MSLVKQEHSKQQTFIGMYKEHDFKQESLIIRCLMMATVFVQFYKKNANNKYVIYFYHNVAIL